MGRATRSTAEAGDSLEISIHALRGEGDTRSPPLERSSPAISIHALRGEGDEFENAIRDKSVISIHALRGEGDLRAAKNNINEEIFQSTPSVGRATRDRRAV